jgi:DNA-binding CsgD family transcriptional regulator
MDYEMSFVEQALRNRRAAPRNRADRRRSAATLCTGERRPRRGLALNPGRERADNHDDMQTNPSPPVGILLPPGERQVSYRVESRSELLAAMVAALINDVRPHARVLSEHGPSSSERGIRVTFEESGRWLYVSPRGRPDQSSVEALSEGAASVLTLDATRDEFLKAIEALENGQQYLPPAVVRWLAGEALGRRSERGALPGDARLTAREREILRLVAQGCSNTEIGETLMISTNTVRTHLHTLSVKLDATSRTKMLANARALDIPEAFGRSQGMPPPTRVSA